MDDLKVMFPDGIKVTVKGEEFHLMPIGLGKYSKVITIIKKMLGDAGAKPYLENISDENNKGKMISFIFDNFDMFIELSACIIGKNVEFFDDVMPDEGVNLIEAIIKVNADFFLKRVLPLVTQKIETLGTLGS